MICLIIFRSATSIWSANAASAGSSLAMIRITYAPGETIGPFGSKGGILGALTEPFPVFENLSLRNVQDNVAAARTSKASTRFVFGIYLPRHRGRFLP